MIYRVTRTSTRPNKVLLPGESEPQPCEDAECRDGVWVVDIPDLAALEAFIDKHGKIVIRTGDLYDDDADDRRRIEIYDDYRE